MLGEDALRDATIARLNRRWAGEENTILVEEFGTHFGSARIDIAVVNGSLWGYEIKSAHDRLHRLARQVDAFSEVFDYASVVAADRHFEACMTLVPSWWGVIEATPSRVATRLTERRRPRRNQNLSPVAVARLLWRDELLSALETLEADRGVRSANRPVLAERLAQELCLDDLRSTVRQVIRARRQWRADEARMQDGGTSPLVRRSSGFPGPPTPVATLSK